MNFREGDKVEVARDIYRWAGGQKDLYAARGEPGIIQSTFKSAMGRTSRWYAKVYVGGGELKTLRLTSLRKSNSA